jgi:cytochrome c5
MKSLVAALVAASVLVAPAAYGGGGQELFEKKCTKCHGAYKTEAKKASKEWWVQLVQRMQKKRSNFIPDAEAAQISAWLGEKYGST